MSLLLSASAALVRAVYAVMKALTRPRHKVVVLSRQSHAVSRDLTAIVEALRSQDPSLEVVVRCKMIGTGALDRVRDVAEMLVQMYHLATCRACIVDGYVVPVSLLDHRPGTFIVQVWHALGAVKRFGWQTVGLPGGHSAVVARVMRMHHNYDLVCCGGPATVEAFSEAFGTDASKVEPLGLPRMDRLRDSAVALASGTPLSGTARLLAEHPMLAEAGRPVVLYAPTFRRDSAAPYAEVVTRFAESPVTLVVRPHPLESVSVSGVNVVDASGAELADVLPLCSAVVTDYSAIAFEAATISLPVFFYVPDHDRYLHSTGLNLDPLAEFPAVSSTELEPIASAIEAGALHPEVAQRLREGYASAAPGCAERIAQRVLAESGGRAGRERAVKA